MRRDELRRADGPVRVIMGDTDNTPYGGGTWASRAAGIGGEAAWQAGKALRQNVLAVAGSILQAKPETLDIRNGVVVDAATGTERIGLDEVARIAYFRPDTLPAGIQAELVGDAPLRAARLGRSPSPTASRRAISRSTPTPASSSCSSTGASRTAAP